MSELRCTWRMYRYYRQCGMRIVPAIRQSLRVVNNGF